MEILTLEKAAVLNNDCKYVYNNPLFHLLNRHKVEDVFCCMFGEGKFRAGIIGGVKDGIIRIPYSSPFAMLELYKDSSIKEIDEYIEELGVYAKERNIKEIYIKLPPLFYDESKISKVLSALLRAGYVVDELELNYQLKIEGKEKYIHNLKRNAKKNLNQALKCDLKIEHCRKEEEKKLAYEIIKVNRESKGYYLSMTWNDIRKTIEVIEHDFFILKMDDKQIASAIVFRVTSDVWQVIYWGDIPGYSEYRPINYLAYYLYNYYLEKEIRVLDIGPSMIDGMPNYGLCDFKESIGCSISSKFILKRYVE